MFVRLSLIAAFLLFGGPGLIAQMEVTSGFPYTPEVLVETVFLGDGLEVLDVTYEGQWRATGFFQGGENAVDMERGILLSTGRAKGTFSQADIESVGSENASADLPDIVNGDPDLQQYLGAGGSLHDVARYTIRFRPFGDSVRFRYVFGSEEYPEFVCSAFNDIFGFFLSGPGINGPFSNGAINIARVPGTDLPVRINTVNGGQASGSSGDCVLTNSAFFRNNNQSSRQPVYDGLTTIFVAEAAVIPCEEYVMKLVIADVSDGDMDSGVFLEAKSFSGNALDLEFGGVSIDNGMAEGCRDANLTFRRGSVAPEDDTLQLRVFGDATPGVDYTPLPPTVIIPAGSDRVSYTLSAFEDGIAEGVENIHFELRLTDCLTDTFTLRISDDLLAPGPLIDSLEVCPGDTVALNAGLTISTPPPPRFQSTDTIMVEAASGVYSSFINVTGVAPESLGPGVIRSVCIDSFVHQWLDDLDLYLIGPSGQILELTTDNGGDGGNLAGEDAYVRTCFTPRATDSLVAPASFAGPEGIPFTGDWLPEGSWAGFTSSYFPTNGRWELRVIDDANGFTGTLYGWSIEFEPVYGIGYSWSPDTSLSCYDCPEPLYLGEAVGTFYARATDVYGCSLLDSVYIGYRPTPSLAGARCTNATDSSLTISWDPTPEALGYEVRRAGGRWISVGPATAYTFSGLWPDSTHSLYVRALFTNCPSPQFNLFCRTAPCIPPVLSLTTTGPSCAGDTDGSLTLNGSGGRGNLSYFFGDSLLTTSSVAGLGAGEYPLALVDTVGCLTDTLVSLFEPEAVVASPLVRDSIRCAGETNGVILAGGSGGTLPFRFRWEEGSTDSLRTGLGVGDYTLIVNDARGCGDTATVSLADPPVLRLDPPVATGSGCIAPDGTISVVVTGGRTPYDYRWNDGSLPNQPGLDGLAAGVYLLTVTDAGGCVDTGSVRVRQERVDIVSRELNPNDCPEETEGTARLAMSGFASPVNYEWEGPGGFQSSATATDEVFLTGLASGNYRLTLTDARGCTAEESFEIVTHSTLAGSGRVTAPDCTNPRGGAIDWMAASPSANWQYAWSNGQTTEDLADLGPGTYVLTVTDELGCRLEQPYVLPPIVLPEVTATIGPVSCAGLADGSINAFFQDFTPPLEYRWITPTGDTLPGGNLSGLSGGSYQLSGRDGGGCPLDTQFILEEPAPLELRPFWEDIRCAGETNGLIELDATGGTPGYQYRLVGRTEWSTNGSFINLVPGIYQAEVRDQRGCRDGSGTINLSAPPPLELDLGETRQVHYGDSIQLYPGVGGGSGSILTYRWEAGTEGILSCRECAIPWVAPVGQTDVFLTITDTRGCRRSDRLRLLVVKHFPVLVPTGFSPNGDGQNDRLLVHGMPGTQIQSFQVFDRWGELIFEGTDFSVNARDAGWDGTFRASPVPAGDYLWQLSAVLPDGSVVRKRGQTTVIR